MPDPIASLTLIGADLLAGRVSMTAAIEGVGAALRSGYDPDDDLPRTIVDVPGGQLLLMPAALDGAAGQKLATVAPDNPRRGLERIQALYILLDGETLAPTALIDGTALTSLRTPAVSAAVADLLAAPDAADLVVFGTGPQAVRHVEAFASIRPVRSVRLIGRNPERAEAAVESARAYAPHADVRVGSVADVASADLLVCATTAAEPLFAAELVRDDATVVAVGSHEPDRAELEPALLARSQVVVESRRVARTEAGDVIRAVAAGALREDHLVTMHEVFTGSVAVAADRPRVLKTCGMGWQDLVVARLAV